ncbi:hypothetical protein EKI60_01650 [Candidatus Saccharibacteria bacterium]|nr:MAG: hypothetical protein EKI60_01650 [Candidatus Saccharibacteria bacterium]
MSLLSNLTLDYEILADDPIEMGIRYGKSILSSVSNTVVAAEQFVEQQQFKKRQTVPVKVQVRATAARRPQAAQRNHSSSSPRRSFIDYSARSTAMGYSRRNMVGAL